ncbi:hypothetical protein [Phyllobacterium ifriqiyense]|uniref:hypothetical protein n=1 Tax=Phyllobacterium ifriqiyense TaxID=314238 RepID=UPI003391D6BC
MPIEDLVSEREYWLDYKIEMRAQGFNVDLADSQIRLLDQLITEKNIHGKYFAALDMQGEIIDWIACDSW